MAVAEVASGLSTKISTFLIILASSESVLISFAISYNISCVLPTAKDGIITFPPFEIVVLIIFISF